MQEGRNRERSRQTDVWGFPAKTQLDFFAKDGRAREEEQRTRGGNQPKGEEHRKKKNRRSVGKRNYRLMRRSFRHVGFERESAIGRCFFAEVIRVSARSLSSLSYLFFSRSRACSNAIFFIRAPREPPWYIHLPTSIGKHVRLATSRSR